MTVKDQFHGVLGLSKTQQCVSEWQNPEYNGKRGCAHIFVHPCESAVSTLDDHNFLVQTSIRALLDFTESSLSLEFYKMKFLAKPRAEHWARS